MKNAFPPMTSEEGVPPYLLPDPLRLASGDRVESVADWELRRRPELLSLFRREVYGRRLPPRPVRATLEESGPALDGQARREQVRLDLGAGHAINLLLHRPVETQGASPWFLGLNFKGNPATSLDPAILPVRSWQREATERGAERRRWPLEKVIGAGFGVATFYYGDVAPDDPAHWRAVCGGDGPASVGDEPGAIALWAWGLSHALDYLFTRPEVDQARVAVIGHSRQGKAALWAGAEDRRFALMISNDSGCTGAALSRRRFGERLVHLNHRFPHWACGNYHAYNEREEALPIDQHELIALLAPRPVAFGDASEDLWADPKGSFVSASGAAPVYALWGGEPGLGEQSPSVGEAVGDQLQCHLRAGPHDLLEADWHHYLSFAQRHFYPSV